MGLAAMSTLAINATNWFDAYWAREKGLYSEVFENAESMDAYINSLSNQIALSHVKATTAQKKYFGEGTENWDDLLMEEQKYQEKELILSDFRKMPLKKYKANNVYPTKNIIWQYSTSKCLF